MPGTVFILQAISGISHAPMTVGVSASITPVTKAMSPIMIDDFLSEINTPPIPITAIIIPISNAVFTVVKMFAVRLR